MSVGCGARRKCDRERTGWRSDECIELDRLVMLRVAVQAKLCDTQNQYGRQSSNECAGIKYSSFQNVYKTTINSS